ncbi:MAG: P-II family nitrogen regulator, partial [Candidatus Omnitrophica bacterium]|nr:P-II family nitrogen regulator [Candidatus Omnitrophota bacterium]
PKELLMITCKDKDVKIIVNIIIKSSRTGNIGDGKIFIVDVVETINIRTGNTGEETL